VRANGVRSLDVECHNCRHRVIMNVDHLPGDLTVPSLGPKMVCTRCEMIGADVRPNLVVALCNGSSHGGAPMMIAMLIAFTIGSQNFERYEPMPNLTTCWQRAPERMNALLAAHPEITKLAVGCVINNGDPI
jgi:hypothetical protein